MAAVVLEQNQLDQRPKPLTYLRQVLALMLDPALLARSDSENAVSLRYPVDTIDCAKRLLAAFPGGSVGSYTHTGGQHVVRQLCADYLTRRDGPKIPASRVADVHVTCGSAEAVRLLLEGFGRRRPKPASALIPAPGRSMYAAFAEQVGVLPVPYRLVAPPQAGWQLDESELESAYQAALEAGSEPRILVLQNPGSPTGQLLTLASLQLAADFARRRRLLVIADETLQFAMFDAEQFVGFRRVAQEQQQQRPLEVASLASLSEGLCGGGEAGLRVGFCELLNLHSAANAALLAVLACTSCPPVLGQAALAISLAPPKPGDASYDAYAAELAAAAGGLRRKASLVGRALAESGVASLAPLPSAGGCVYPRLRTPTAWLISIANEKAEAPVAVDVAYCREFQRLEGEGETVWLQPGSAFGQPAPEDKCSFYASISMKCSERVLLARLNRLIAFHQELLKRFAH